MGGGRGVQHKVQYAKSNPNLSFFNPHTKHLKQKLQENGRKKEKIMEIDIQQKALSKSNWSVMVMNLITKKDFPTFIIQEKCSENFIQKVDRLKLRKSETVSHFKL